MRAVLSRDNQSTPPKALLSMVGPDERRRRVGKSERGFDLKGAGYGCFDRNPAYISFPGGGRSKISGSALLVKLKLELKLFTTCTVCAGLQQVPYAQVVVSGTSQQCHTRNLQVRVTPLTTYIQSLQRVLGGLTPPRGVRDAGWWRRAVKGVRRCSVWRRSEW
jgi:hypothetical protein